MKKMIHRIITAITVYIIDDSHKSCNRYCRSIRLKGSVELMILRKEENLLSHLEGSFPAVWVSGRMGSPN